MCTYSLHYFIFSDWMSKLRLLTKDIPALLTKSLVESLQMLMMHSSTKVTLPLMSPETLNSQHSTQRPLRWIILFNLSFWISNVSLQAILTSAVVVSTGGWTRAGRWTEWATWSTTSWNALITLGIATEKPVSPFTISPPLRFQSYLWSAGKDQSMGSLVNCRKIWQEQRLWPLWVRLLSYLKMRGYWSWPSVSWMIQIN